MTIGDDNSAPQALEQALLHTDFREAVHELEAVLAPDFIEIGPHGQVVERRQVIQWLLTKDPAARWDFSDWQQQALAPGWVLLNYHARQVAPLASGSSGSRRASLWRRDESGQWQLVFHQATPVLLS